MTINEIASGSSITLEASLGSSKIEFESVLLAPLEKQNGAIFGAIIPIIKQSDKILTFNGVKVKAIVTNIDDNRVYNFNIVKFVRSTYEGGQCYIILSPDNIKPINHREAVRVPYCKECVLQVGEHKKALECYVRDVSQTGISFSCAANSFKYKVGEEVSAQFKIDGNPVKISAKVVRGLTEKGTNRDVIGCSLNREYPVINKLVCKLQTRNRT